MIALKLSSSALNFLLGVFSFCYSCLGCLFIFVLTCCVREQGVLFLWRKERGRGKLDGFYQRVPRALKLCSLWHYLLCPVTFPQLNGDCRAFISN